MNLEHYRKDAKRLLRAFAAGDPDARARATERLGERARERFLLTDAQHVVAVDAGYRSWPELRQSVGAAAVAGRGGAARNETVIDTGIEYRPGDPVRVRVVRREQRITVTDDGAAIAAADRPPHWREVADRVEEDLVVNVSRHGVISLPVVPVGPAEEEIVRRIAHASVTFYDALLELLG